MSEMAVRYRLRSEAGRLEILASLPSDGSNFMIEAPECGLGADAESEVGLRQGAAKNLFALSGPLPHPPAPCYCRC